MKLSFYGADQCVTGSCHCLEVNGKRILVDCGLQQGRDEIDNAALPFHPGSIDAVLVTHAHIDHSGRIPMLIKNGFAGPIITTRVTANLLDIMLQDSAHIQEQDAEYHNLKNKRAGWPEVEPIYTVEDAMRVREFIQPCEYGQQVQITDDVTAEFIDAGHLLGSASIRLTCREGGETRTVVFSGDIGNVDQPIIRNPQFFDSADYVLMESTYGDRNHKNESTSTEELAEAVAYSHARGEKVIIPAFAVERTQEVLYCLHMLNSQGKLPEDMPVFVDSPLAIRATEIFERNRELFDEDAKALLGSGDDPFSLPNLHYTLSTAESQAINEISGPAIVISASGMCNAGRIKHHLKHNIWRPGASVVFVGYQAVGTPGRKLVEQAKKITLFGEDMEVKARIFTINGFSGHAGQSQLLDWLAPLTGDGTQVVLVHGENSAQTTLAGLIQERFSLAPLIPEYLEEMVLEGGRVAQTVLHESQAHPKVDWNFLTGELERKWDMFKGKLADVEGRPWVEQTELQEALAKMDYAMTRLLSRM